MSEVEATDAIKQLGTQALQDLYANLTQAKSFAIEQAPDFCQQVISFQIACSIASTIAWLIGAFILATLAWKLRHVQDKDGFPAPTVVISMLGGGIMLPVFACGICPSIYYGIKASVAPKLYLVEYIAHLLK